MNQTEETKLLEQIEKWNDADEFSRCIEAIEAIPEQERGYLLTVKLSRAYSNLAALGDHGEHGTDGEVDGDLIRHAIELLESVRTQGENDPYWNARMGYSCLMAYGSATTAYEYAKRWLSLAPDDPDAQELVRDCEKYLEEENSLELDWKEREEIIRREFDTEVRIRIRQEEGYDPGLYTNDLQTMQNAMSHDAAQAQKEYVRMQAQQAAYNGGAAVQETALLPRTPCIDSALDTTPRRIGDTVWQIGHSRFDVSEPKVLLGTEFEITPTSIASVSHPQKNIVFLGEVFNFTAEENRTGDKMDVTFDLYDGGSSIEHRTFGMEIEDAKSLSGIVRNGGVYAMRGYVKQITRKGKQCEHSRPALWQCGRCFAESPRPHNAYRQAAKCASNQIQLGKSQKRDSKIRENTQDAAGNHKAI